MKRKSSRYRVMRFSARLAKTDPTPDALVQRFPLASGQSSIRARRIFVIKRVSLLPAPNTLGKTIQRILIFDDHPASLRLVFGRRTSPQTDRRTSQSAGWWESILAWMLIAGALIVVLAAFFLKLRA
jgi:hypothetical protein